MGLFSDWRHGNEIRLAIMFLLTTIYFVIEIFVGYSSNCMALVADSFHMLSDVVALAVAFGAVVIAPKQWSKSTFGWARAEVLGALINSVFLLALCFSILMESLKRFYAMEPIDNPFLVFVVGLVGLGVNLIGLAIFGGHVHHGHDHGHGHAGHSHGHAHHGHSHKQHKHGDSHPGEKHRHGQDKSLPVLAEAPCDIAEHEVLNIGVRRPSLKAASMRGANAYVLMDGVASLADLSKTQCQQNVHHDCSTAALVNHEYCDEELAEKVRESTKIVIESTHASMKKVDSPNGALAGSHQFIRSSSPDQEKKHNHSNMNMHGVFLHVLGDALGSVIVVISAAVFYWTDWEYRFYLDPVLSIIMTIIITRSTIPLLKESCLILLQTFPSHLDLGGIKEALATIDGIHGVHELHVWRLTCDRVIASAHITFTSLEAYHKAGSEVKKVFHNEGIYSTTIQPEVLEIQEETILAYNSEKGFGGVCATGKPCELREFPQDAGKNAEERKKSSRKVQNGNLAAHPLGQIEGGGSLNARPTWPQKHTVVKNGRVVTSSANHEQASDSFGSAGCVLTAVVPLNDEENERLPSHGNHTLVVNGLPPSGAVTAPDGNATDGEKISTLKDHSDRKSAA